MSFTDSLKAKLAELGCCAGSVHFRRLDGLRLEAHIGLPKPVISLITRIPKGKGMAGQAWLRREPITTCNLKTDQSAPIEPGARQVDARSAVAIPVTDHRGEVMAVVGLAFRDNLGVDGSRLNECTVAAREIVQMGPRSREINSSAPAEA